VSHRQKVLNNRWQMLKTRSYSIVKPAKNPVEAGSVAIPGWWIQVAGEGMIAADRRGFSGSLQLDESC